MMMMIEIVKNILCVSSLVATLIKNPPAVQETLFRFLG